MKLSMHSKLLSIMGLASVMGGMGAGYPMDSSMKGYDPILPEPFSFKKFKHTGELPKGCKIETLPMEIIKETKNPKGEWSITLEMDIVYGTMKSFYKKHKQYQNEIVGFIQRADINTLRKHIGDITLEDLNPPKDLVNTK